MPLTRTRALLAVLLTGQAMATMDNSIVAVAVRTIRADLSAGPAAAQLVLAGYTLAFGVLVITGARLGDRYGHRRVFQLGLAGFTLASLGCGLAPTAPILVGARIGQGAAAALLVPQVLALIQVSFTGPARIRAVGLYSMVLALGVAAGQVLGGLIVTLDLADAGWRPAFLLNVPVGLALLLAAHRLIPTSAVIGPTDPPLGATTPKLGRRRDGKAQFRQNWAAGGAGGGGRLDLGGVVLLTATMGAVVAPLALGNEPGWPRAGWLLLAVGVVGLGVLFRYQRRLAAAGGDPLIPPAIWRIPTVRAGLLACFLIMGCYAAFLFTFTLHLQEGLGLSPLAAGAAFVPYALGFALCGLSVGRLAARWPRALPVFGPATLGTAILAAAWLGREDWPSLLLAPVLLLGGAGHAAGFSPLVGRMTAAVPAALAGALSGLVSTGTLLASALGVTIVGGAYLAAAGSGGAASSLLPVAALLVPLLLVGATAAARAVSPTGSAGGDQDPGPRQTVGAVPAAPEPASIMRRGDVPGRRRRRPARADRRSGRSA